jgi:hypothetical protein
MQLPVAIANDNMPQVLHATKPLVIISKGDSACKHVSDGI